jgi:hypothetical protein
MKGFPMIIGFISKRTLENRLFRTRVLSKKQGNKILNHTKYGAESVVAHEAVLETISLAFRFINWSLDEYKKYRKMTRDQARFRLDDTENVRIKGNKSHMQNVKYVLNPLPGQPKVDQDKVYRTIKYAASAHEVDAGDLTELWMHSISDPIFMGSVDLKDYDLLIKSLAFSLRAVRLED